MRRYAVYLICLLCVGCVLPQSPAPEFKLNSINFTPPKAQEWRLSNGLTVYYLEDNELPLVSGFLMYRGGKLWETKKVSAVALGDLLRSGGTQRLSPEELDLELETLAASISSSFGEEYGQVSFKCLSDDVDSVFSLFADVVRKPRFDTGRFQLFKMGALESIRRRIDDPEAVASLTFNRFLMGDNVFGRISGSADVNSLNLTDLTENYRKFVRPQGAILGLSGSLDEQTARKLVEKYFGDWKSSVNIKLEPPELNFTPQPGIYFVELPLAQATILMGQQGVPRLTPDQIQIEVFNYIFGGGGFTSRLMKRVRESMGLTYFIHGGISPGLVRGRNSIFVQTKNETVVSTIDESLQVLQGMQAEPIGSSELELSKQSTENSYVFKFDQKSDVVYRQALLNFLNYPKDYDQNYIRKINGVSAEDVLKVAQARWDISKFVIVVVGNKTAYTPLTELARRRGIEFFHLGFTEMPFIKNDN